MVKVITQLRVAVELEVTEPVNRQPMPGATWRSGHDSPTVGTLSMTTVAEPAAPVVNAALLSEQVSTIVPDAPAV